MRNLEPYCGEPAAVDMVTETERAAVRSLVPSAGAARRGTIAAMNAWAQVTGVPVGWIIGWVEAFDNTSAAEAVAMFRRNARLSRTDLPADVIAAAYRPDEEGYPFLQCRNGSCCAHPGEEHAEDCPVGDLLLAMERAFAQRAPRRLPRTCAIRGRMQVAR